MACGNKVGILGKLWTVLLSQLLNRLSIYNKAFLVLFLSFQANVNECSGFYFNGI